jgi:hypothetical protein
MHFEFFGFSSFDLLSFDSFNVLVVLFLHNDSDVAFLKSSLVVLHHCNVIPSRRRVSGSGQCGFPVLKPQQIV